MVAFAAAQTTPGAEATTLGAAAAKVRYRYAPVLVESTRHVFDVHI